MEEIVRKNLFAIFALMVALLVSCSNPPTGKAKALIPILGMKASSKSANIYNRSIVTGFVYPNGYSDSTDDIARVSTPILTGWEDVSEDLHDGDMISYSLPKFGYITITISINPNGTIIYDGLFSDNKSWFKISLNEDKTFIFQQRIIYELWYTNEQGGRNLINQWFTDSKATGIINDLGFDASGNESYYQAWAGSIADPLPTNMQPKYLRYSIKARDGFYGMLYDIYGNETPIIQNTYAPIVFENAETYIALCESVSNQNPVPNQLIYTTGNDTWNGIWDSSALSIWNEH